MNTNPCPETTMLDSNTIQYIINSAVNSVESKFNKKFEEQNKTIETQQKVHELAIAKFTTETNFLKEQISGLQNENRALQEKYKFAEWNYIMRNDELTQKNKENEQLKGKNKEALENLSLREKENRIEVQHKEISGQQMVMGEQDDTIRKLTIKLEEQHQQIRKKQEKIGNQQEKIREEHEEIRKQNEKMRDEIEKMENKKRDPQADKNLG